ncbi:MAG TPA: LPS export ABC transporter periplasmic protein LptC [Solimonas sp.]|nr:LPS export ABC transporter periplasmic protein LptC [Solimonas sp.]
MLLLPVLFVGLAVWLALNDRLPEPVALAGADGTEQPRYRMEGVQWTRYGADGLPRFQAQAERADYYDDEALRLSGVGLDRLGGRQGAWTLRAPQGRVPAGETRMRLGPAVQIEGRDRRGAPVTIAARQVWVDWEARTIRSQEPVQLRSPGTEVDAVGLEADWSGQRLRLLNRVEMRHVAPG